MMFCPDKKIIWEKYINGSANKEEQAELEDHLEECERCSKYLNQKLMASTPEQKPRNNDRFRHIDFSSSLRKAKWKQRLSQTTFVIALVVFVLLIGSFVSNFYYSAKKQERIRTVETAAVESFFPNVRSQGGWSNIKPFFGMESRMGLVKDIGNDSKPVGQLKFSYRFNKVKSAEKLWSEGQYKLKLYFVPPSVKKFDDLKHWNDEFWQAVEKLPDGTVSEVAFSFDRAYTIKELNEMLSKIIIDDRKMPVWYAVDTGEMNQEDPFIGPGQVFGFNRYLTLDEEFDGKNFTQEQKITRMAQLLSENEESIKQMDITTPGLSIKQKYNYIKKNGVKVYGVVLTGPTKDFLEFKDLKQVKFATLGEVELWNWYDRPVSGAAMN